MTTPAAAGSGPGKPAPGDAPSAERGAAARGSAPPAASRLSGQPTSDPRISDPRIPAQQTSDRPQVAPSEAGEPDDLAGAAARALAAHVGDRAAPLAEFGCGRGEAGAALARAGFTTIDGFDPSEENLAAARRTGIYRRLARADAATLDGIAPGIYANAAAIAMLDPDRTPPQALDALLALLPPGGCLVFALPGAGASVGRFRTRVLELCEHFVAEPVFRGPVAAHAPTPSERGLQTTLYVLKKR